MRRFVLWGASLYLCAAFAVPLQAQDAGDRRIDKTRLRVMALNAEFLWDGDAPEDGQVQFPWRFSPDEAREHMQAVAEIIKRHDPDLVCLSEVESLAALNVFLDEFLLGRGYSAHLVDGRDTYTGQDVALLSRITPKDFDRDDLRAPYNSHGGTYGVSKNYYAAFEVENLKFSLVGLHFLARPLSESRRAKREAQAAVIRDRAMALADEGFPPIVLGDFNDYDGEVLDAQGSTPISTVLETVKGMGPGGADDLLNVASRVAQHHRSTSWWDANQNDTVDASEYTSIDHILVPPELASHIENVEFDTSHDPRLVTDHFPVIVTFRFGTADNDVGPSGQIRIKSLLPNPAGNESVNEAITLISVGGDRVSLTGWRVRDRAEREWDLAEDSHVEGERVVLRNNRPMALNNGGDRVELIDPSDQVVQSLTYERVEEGEIVYVGGIQEPVVDPGEKEGTPDSPPPTEDQLGTFRVRVMAANTTSGNEQSYDPGHGTRIFMGLDPDVVLIQEFNFGSNSQADLRSFVDTAFGQSFHYSREDGAQIPNGVVSRWPILESGKWEDDESPNREFAWARIDLPGSADLWAVSVHFLTRNASTRATEASQLLDHIREHVPPEAYLVVGGDLNTRSSSEAALAVLDTMLDLEPVPTDSFGRRGTNASRTRPYDWVMPDDDLGPLEVGVRIGSAVFETGLVFDSRVFSPLSAVDPVLLGDSGGPQMQHMAVVKDFVLQIN